MIVNMSGHVYKYMSILELLASGISQKSDLLQIGRSGARIPVEARFSMPSRPAAKSAKSPVKWVPCLSRM